MSDSRLFRVVVACVRFTDASDRLVAGLDEGMVGYDIFNAADEELREAALAYTRSLSPVDRARIGKAKS